MADLIDHQRYNTIRDLMVQIMGEGFGAFGYGQTNLLSSRVTQNTQILAAHINNLRSDVLRMRQHQLGLDRTTLLPTDAEFLAIVKGGEVSIEERDYIQEVHFANLNTACVNGQADKFKIGGHTSGNQEFSIETYLDTPNGPGTQGGARSIRTADWASELNHTIKISFRNGQEARWFFNSGGEIRITPALANYDTTAGSKGQAWADLLNTKVGTVRLGYNYTINDGNGGGGSSIGFYQLNTVPQLIYNKSSNPNYTENEYKIYASCNSLNNDPDSDDYRADVATWITIEIQFIDSHQESVTTEVDPNTGITFTKVNPDEPITGLLSSEVSQRRATGTNVTVYGPSYYEQLSTIGSGAVPLPPTSAPTYTISMTPTPVYEGGTITFRVNANNVPDGTTLYYSITGVSTDDWTDGTLTESFNVINSIGIVTKTATSNAGDTLDEPFIFRVHTGSSTGPIVATANTFIAEVPILGDMRASVVPTQNNGFGPFVVNETTNNSITFNYQIFNRQNRPVYWGVVGGPNNDASDYTGDITGELFGDSGQFTVTIRADALTEGTEYFTIRLWEVTPDDPFHQFQDVILIGDTST